MNTISMSTTLRLVSYCLVILIGWFLIIWRFQIGNHLRLRDYPRKSIQQNERELICNSFPRDTKDWVKHALNYCIDGPSKGFQIDACQQRCDWSAKNLNVIGSERHQVCIKLKSHFRNVSNPLKWKIGKV